jgi:hypothetical protein
MSPIRAGNRAVERLSNSSDGMSSEPANLIDYLVRSIPSDIKSSVIFLNGLTLRRHTLTLQFQLLDPATQHRFSNANRSARIHMAVALVKNQGCYIALEFGRKRTTLIAR